ncbi:hypothetical protein Tco_0072061 [Tanacetum coccineum]
MKLLILILQEGSSPDIMYYRKRSRSDKARPLVIPDTPHIATPMSQQGFPLWSSTNQAGPSQNHDVSVVNPDEMPREAIDEEAILEEQILALMHRFADRFTDRRVEINNLMVLHDHPLIDYGKYALRCMTEADMKNVYT